MSGGNSRHVEVIQLPNKRISAEFQRNVKYQYTQHWTSILTSTWMLMASLLGLLCPHHQNQAVDDFSIIGREVTSMLYATSVYTES